ncbi:MAG: FAD-binding oxidoreductase, partial [Pseudomonadota bacterium]
MGKFVATPMEGRLRCAGLVEFGGLSAQPSQGPFDLLMRKARETFPDLTWQETREWMGHRPSTSDSLPVIGPTVRFPNVHCAFGHQHIGLTGSAKTARIVSDIILGRRPNIDLAPYRTERFT